MIKSLDYLILGQYPENGVEGMFEMAARHGFDAIEMTPAQVLEYGAEGVNRLVKETGLTVCGFSLPFKAADISDEDFADKLQQFDEQVKVMSEVGCPLCHTFVRNGSDLYEYDDNFRFHVNRFRQVAEVLDRYNMKLALEFMGPKTAQLKKKYPFIRTAEEMVRLCREIGDNCGMVFDFWHWYSGANNKDVFENIDGIKYIYNIHLNDAQPGEVDTLPDKPRALVGTSGVIDTPFLVSKLKEYGFEGALVSESFDPRLAECATLEEKVTMIKEAMDKALDQKKDLTVAYIGFGLSVKSYHLPYVRVREDRIKVKYIYRRAEDVEKEGTEEEKYYPDIIFTSDIDQVMNDPEVNLVVVNTPDKFHSYYSKMALEHGKNVLCEKPFALSVEEAKEVFDLAREKGLFITANQNRRFDADMRTVRKVIESGKLGQLVEFESHYDYYRPKWAGWKGFDFIKGIGIHPLDQIVGQFGVPEKCVYDCRCIDLPGESDTYYDIDLFYGPTFKAICKMSIYVMIDYPKFILHGKKGSFIMPALGHNSSKAQKPGPVEVSFEPLPESTWGTLRYINEEGQVVTEKVPTEVCDYGLIYDNIIDVLNHKAEPVVKEEEILAVLDIVAKGIEAAKGVK